MGVLKDVSLLLGIILTLYNIVVIVKRGINSNYHNKKTKENMSEKIEKHELSIKDLGDSLKDVNEKMNTLFEITKIQTRQVIVSLCLKEIEKGSIDQYQLRAIEDLYSMYKDTLNGNSYVSTIVTKVRKLKVDVDD